MYNQSTCNITHSIHIIHCTCTCMQYVSIISYNSALWEIYGNEKYCAIIALTHRNNVHTQIFPNTCIMNPRFLNTDINHVYCLHVQCVYCEYQYYFQLQKCHRQRYSQPGKETDTNNGYDNI